MGEVRMVKHMKTLRHVWPNNRENCTDQHHIISCTLWQVNEPLPHILSLIRRQQRMQSNAVHTWSTHVRRVMNQLWPVVSTHCPLS